MGAEAYDASDDDDGSGGYDDGAGYGDSDGEAADDSSSSGGGVSQQKGYDHEVAVTPSHEGEQQAYYTPTCDCGWAGEQQHGGQGAWDTANNEGVQHVQSAQDGRTHTFTIGVYQG